MTLGGRGAHQAEGEAERKDFSVTEEERQERKETTIQSPRLGR